MNARSAILRSKWFSESEFPETALGVDPELIDRLDELRDRLNAPVHPSRDPGGWVRFSGSEESRHYVMQADAGDVFPERALDAFLIAVHLFCGVGIYYDTNRSDLQPGAMLHVDLRPDLTIWCRHEGRYIYPARSIKERKAFWRLANLYSEGRL